VLAKIEPVMLSREHSQAPTGGMLIVAAGGAIVGADAQAVALFGYTDGDLLQAAFGDLITLSDTTGSAAAMLRLRPGRRPGRSHSPTLRGAAVVIAANSLPISSSPRWLAAREGDLS